MPKKKKTDSCQLMLDFERSMNDLKVAVDKFGDAASKLVAARTDNPEAGPEVDEETKALRTQVNKLVRILADQTGLDFHTVWVLAYHEHHQRTGFHAVAEGKAKGPHLDVIQSSGQLPKLQETVVGMLTDPKYGRKR
jgi:hypothetical protein